MTFRKRKSFLRNMLHETVIKFFFPFLHFKIVHTRARRNLMLGIITAMTSLVLAHDDYSRTPIAVYLTIAEFTESHWFLLAVVGEFTERFEFFFSIKIYVSPVCIYSNITHYSLWAKRYDRVRFDRKYYNDSKKKCTNCDSLITRHMVARRCK